MGSGSISFILSSYIWIVWQLTITA